MVRNQGRKAPISVFLVAIMITSALTGLMIGGVPSAAAVSVGMTEPSPVGSIGPQTPTSFSYTVTAGSEEVESSYSCTVYADPDPNDETPGIDISDEVTPDPADCSTDSNTATWTPDDAVSPANGQTAYHINVTVEWTGTVPSQNPQDQTASNSVVRVDTTAPTVTPDSESIWQQGQPAIDETVTFSDGPGGEFSVDDAPNPDGVSEVRLEVDGTEVDADSDRSDGFSLEFNPTSVNPGTYGFDLIAVDAAGNEGNDLADSVRVDAVKPVLERAVITGDGGGNSCTVVWDQTPEGDEFEIGTRAALCSGPYDLQISVAEDFPADTDPDAGPDAPTLSAGPGGVALALTTSDEGVGGQYEGVEGATHTWSWKNIGDPGTTVDFLVELTEASGLEKSLSDRPDEERRIRFDLAQAPTVSFDPPTSPIVGSPTFELDRVPPSNGQCLMGVTLGTNDLCIPSVGGQVTIELVDAGSDLGDTADDTVVGSLTNVPADQDSYTLSFDSAPDGYIGHLFVRVTQGIPGTSLKQPVVIDDIDPTMHDLTVYEWDGSNEEWSSTGSPDIPTRGPYLVRFSYTAFSSDEIRFRFVPTSESDVDNPDNFFEYSFFISDDGTGRDTSVSKSARVVRLAKSVPLGTGATAPTGCESTTGPNARLLWGSQRDCYFLIDLHEDPSRTEGSANGASNNQDYRLQPIILENAGQFGPDASDGPTVTGSGPDATFSSTSLDPSVPEEGVSLEVHTEISGANTADIGTWFCVMRADQLAPHGPYFEPATSDQRCDPLEKVGGGPVKARDLAVDPDDDAVRESTFRIQELDTKGTSNELIDTLFLRLIAKDAVGNLVVDDLQTGDPGTFTVARFEVGQDPQEIPVTNPSTTDFRTEDGCWQPAGSVNPPTGCLREIDHVPGDSGTYPMFEFPITIENRGNVPDTIEVVYRQVDDTNNPSWDVELHDPTNGSTVTQEEGTLFVDLQGTDNPNQPTTRKVFLRITPDSTARGGDAKAIEVGALSGQSNQPGTPEIRRVYEASLAPNPLSQISFATDSQITRQEQEVTADETLTIPLQLSNLGNIEPSGGFELKRTTSSSSVCSQVNAARAPDKVRLRLQDTAGQQVTARDIAPGETEDLQLRIDVGANVPSTEDNTYRCYLKLVTDEFDPVELNQTDSLLKDTALLEFSVTGEPDLRILERRNTEAGVQEVDVTGDRITRVIHPENTSANVTLYMENNGTAAQEPELDTPLPKTKNTFGLSGSWTGIDKGGADITVKQAAQAFQIGVSDTDDDAEIETFGSSTWSEVTSDQWQCKAADEDADGDDRRVCKMDFRFDAGSRPLLQGDNVVYEFTWQDQGEPTTVEVELIWAHVGTVTVDDIVDQVTDDDTTVFFDAQTFDGHRFDPTTTSVSATPTFTLDGTPLPSCSSDDPIPALTEDTQEDGTLASFEVPISFQAPSGSDCVEGDTADGYIVRTSAPAALDVGLSIQDDNGTDLRVVHPAQIVYADPAPDSLNPITELDQGPADEMDANGTQFARFRYNDNGQAANLDGVLLNRGDDLKEVAPALRCLPGTSAVTTGAVGTSGGTDLSWTLLEPDALVDDDIGDQSQLTPADGGDGKLITIEGSSTDRRAETVGNVQIFGWGDGDSTLTWREGWNPLVFRVEDLPDQAGEPGDPLAGGDTNLELTLRFLVSDDTDDDQADETNIYTWTWRTDASGSETQALRELGNGYYAADVWLPAGLADPIGDFSGDGEAFQEHPARDDSQSAFDGWAMELRIPSGAQSRGGDQLGDSAAYWRLDALNLVESGFAADDDDDRNATGAIDPAGATTAQSTKEEPDDPDQSWTFLHTGARFLAGDPSDWETGPGVHDVSVYVRQDQMTSEQDDQQVGGMSLDGVREHRFTGYTEAAPTFLWWPSNRGFSAGGQSEAVPHDGNGHHTLAFNIPDLGKTEPFSFRLNIRDKGATTAGGNPTLAQQLMQTATVTVDETLTPATNGIPTPLCIQQPGWADGSVAGVFEPADLGDQTILDLRTIPGLLMDRGPFSLTPFLADGTDPISNPTDLTDVRHDVQSTFTILGEGLVDLTPTDELPSTAEIDVPITLSVRASGPVTSVTATLQKDGATVAQSDLSDPDGDRIYTGSVTPTSDGEHTLFIRAQDSAQGVTIFPVGGQVVDVQANTPPRISITTPAPVDGVRAMQPGATAVATVTDRSIAAQYITVLRQADGSGPGGSPLAASNGVEVTGIDDTVTPGSFPLDVNLTGALGDHAAGDVHAWLNATNSTDDQVASFDDDLDADGNISGSISLDDADTYTLRVVARNASAGEEIANETFSVTVEAATTGFNPVPGDEVNTTCEQTTCTVSYTPADVEGGDTVTFRIQAEITPDDSATSNKTAIVIDSLPPSPEISLGSPSSGDTVSPSTTIEVSAGDNTGVDQLLVTGLAGGTELGSTTVTGDEGEVSASELGLTEDSSATIRLTAVDIAGHRANATREVTVDGTGPELSDVTTGRTNGDLVVRVTAEDSAGVDSITLFFKRPGAASFATSVMQAGDTGDRFATTVSDVGDTGAFRYYIEATDALQNTGSLASSNSPQTVELGDVPIDTNTAPEVSITSPGSGDRVSGVINVTWEVSDAEGDTVSISGVQASPAVGQALSLTAADGQATLDTTQLAEGGLTITVDASDGTATGSDTVQVIVDNLAPPPTCEADAQASAGQAFDVCFELETESSVTQVELQYVRNGEVVVSKTLDPSEDGQYRTSVTFPEAGTYTPKVVKTHDDGTTEETTFETQSVAEAISDAPLGRFIATIILAVAVLGVAGYAAFGRWN